MVQSGKSGEALLEIWRVLVPNGRVIMLVPNRTGWARRDGTPFGTGRPYSRGQLRRMVKQAGFMLRTAVLMVPQLQCACRNTGAPCRFVALYCAANWRSVVGRGKNTARAFARAKAAMALCRRAGASGAVLNQLFYR